MSFPGFLLHFSTPNFVAVILLYLNILYDLNYFLRIYASICAHIYIYMKRLCLSITTALKYPWSFSWGICLTGQTYLGNGVQTVHKMENDPGLIVLLAVVSCCPSVPNGKCWSSTECCSGVFAPTFFIGSSWADSFRCHYTPVTAK